MSHLNPCCLKAVFIACESGQREIASLRAEQAVPSEDGYEALAYLVELVKQRKGGEFEWMPTQAVWRGIRALLVKTGRL